MLLRGGSADETVRRSAEEMVSRGSSQNSRLSLGQDLLLGSEDDLGP